MRLLKNSPLMNFATSSIWNQPESLPWQTLQIEETINSSVWNCHQSIKVPPTVFGPGRRTTWCVRCIYGKRESCSTDCFCPISSCEMVHQFLARKKSPPGSLEDILNRRIREFNHYVSYLNGFVKTCSNLGSFVWVWNKSGISSIIPSCTIYK